MLNKASLLLGFLLGACGGCLVGASMLMSMNRELRLELEKQDAVLRDAEPAPGCMFCTKREGGVR